MSKQIMITEKQILTNPQLPPTTELLQEVMRDNYANFDWLLALFEKQEITTEWNYYKDGKSWLGKAQHKKKNRIVDIGMGRLFQIIFFLHRKNEMWH